MESKYVFTVFTPTYNRKSGIIQIYNSLLCQTFKKFEWIIIDDGSDDNTDLYVKTISLENEIPIKYFWQPNSGKHKAYIQALSMSEGFFFLPLDSDDITLIDSLEILFNTYLSIPENERDKFSAISGLCIDKYGKIIGNKFPADIFDSDPLELYFRYKVGGDKWGFQKTSVRKQFSFPILPEKQFEDQMRFYPEIAIFGEIGKKYKTRYVNKPLKIVEYHSNGLSKSKIRNAYSKKLSAMYKLNFCTKYFFLSPLEFIINIILYTRWSFHSKSFHVVEIKNIFFKFLLLMLLPVSAIIFLLDNKS